MLVVLNIKNFALIQELSVEFGAGFNILSGETGAGKSILIDTIDYVLGGKFSKELIRYGEDKTYVEAIFDMENNEIYTLLNDLNIENDELLVVSRETTISGKSIIKVNGKTIVLSQLKRIREKLLDIHGQHQNQSLLSKGTHILYLDEYNSENISPLLEQFEIVKNRHSQIEDKINELKGNDDREKILDYIKFQIDDIEKAKLKPGEEEDLREQYNILANAEKISSSLINSYNYLNNNPQGNSVLELLSKVISEFSHSEMHLEKIKDKRVQVEEAYYLLEESTRDIRDIANEIYYDENELAAINERIYEISLYKKKYGDSIDEILKFLEKLKNQYDEFINSEEIILNLKKELSVIEKDMSEIGVKLHEFRCMSAKDLEVRIKEELSYVGLEKAIIKIDVKNKADLLSLFQEFNTAKKEYDQIKYALKMVKQTGYGVATPSIEDMKLDKPEIIKQGPRYGVKLKAVAPSIHMIRVDVESTFEPIIGSEVQCKELIDYLTKDQDHNPNEIWKSEIFGRSLDSIVQEGIQSKISLMPDNIRFKLQNTLTKVVNKGSNNMIAIVI